MSGEDPPGPSLRAMLRLLHLILLTAVKFPLYPKDTSRGPNEVPPVGFCARGSVLKGDHELSRARYHSPG